MEIQIGTFFDSESYHSRTSATLTDLEKEISSILLSKVFQDQGLRKHIIFSRRSNNYLTVSIDENYDFLRIKATPRVLWFSVWPAKEDRQNPLFDCVEKKNLVHWKVKLSDQQSAEKYSLIVYHSALLALKYYEEKKKNV